MPDYVILGRDVETDKAIQIGDMERRSGPYILGRTGSGKTTLIKKIIAQDIDNGHGVFFLDPHGDAIEDLLQRIPACRRDDVFVIDPIDETYTFGMNLLACPDISRLDEREKTFDRAKGIFHQTVCQPADRHPGRVAGQIPSQQFLSPDYQSGLYDCRDSVSAH
jgi:hypothetical protein